MDVKKETKQKVNTITIYAAVTLVIVVLNLLFVFLSGSETKTVMLLKNELANIEQEKKIVTGAAELYSQYDSEIQLISAVFPSEETIPVFIGDFEVLIRSVSDEYSFKFTSVTPIKDNDRLFLPITVIMKTDLNRLLTFFANLEKFPYMTHVNLISAKTPNSIIDVNEVQLNLKVYVQNPFTGQ